MEFAGNCNTNKSKSVITSEIQDFINSIEEHYGQTPIIYATKEFYNNYLISNFTKYPIWIRDTYSKPTLHNRKWTFWQFANRGRLNGIDGFTDINVFIGHKEEFQKMIMRNLSISN